MTSVRPKAIIVPHAAYLYSGQVAATAFAALAPSVKTIEGMVLIGPAHTYRFTGSQLLPWRPLKHRWSARVSVGERRLGPEKAHARHGERQAQQGDRGRYSEHGDGILYTRHGTKLHKGPWIGWGNAEDHIRGWLPHDYARDTNSETSRQLGRVGRRWGIGLVGLIGLACQLCQEPVAIENQAAQLEDAMLRRLAKRLARIETDIRVPREAPHRDDRRRDRSAAAPPPCQEQRRARNTLSHSVLVR